MQILAPSRLSVHQTSPKSDHARARRARAKPPVVCQASRVQRRCHLAAAALLSSAALQYSYSHEPAFCASVANVRSPPAGHTLAVKRALLEDLLMQEVGSRLKSMSDADLMTVLEQVHQGRFQLPAAAPSLSTAQPSSDTQSGAGLPSRSTSSSSDGPILRPLIERQSGSIFPSLESATQDGQLGDEQVLPTAASPIGKQGAPQPDAAATKSAPDAWQQQTNRLQAFAKPLMQRLQGAASPQVSQPDADSMQASGQTQNEGFQPKAEQQTQPSQPQPSQPQSTQAQSSQPESSAPASAQQQSGARAQQEGMGSAPSLTLKDQASAQGGPAKGRAVPGQAVSSEELTSSEKGPQSGEGIRGDDEGPKAAQASSSGGTGPLDEQGASSGDGGASGTGQNVDEAEDTTERMMENAGVPLPLSAQNRLTLPGAVSQPGKDSSVREYLGFVWQRTQPQLGLLVVAASISTLAGTAAQISTATSHQEAVLSTGPKKLPVPQVSGASGQQTKQKGQQRLSALSRGLWQGLSAWVGKKMRRGGRQDESAQASGSPQVQGGTVIGNGVGTHEGLSGVHRLVAMPVGKDQVQQEDEWGRPIVQMPAASMDSVHQHQVPGVSQAAEQPGSKILWVRNDPAERDSSNGSAMVDSEADPQNILWQRGPERNHAAEQADGVPRRFRRSRNGKHEVSIESLLDNVE